MIMMMKKETLNSDNNNNIINNNGKSQTICLFVYHRYRDVTDVWEESDSFFHSPFIIWHNMRRPEGASRCIAYMLEKKNKRIFALTYAHTTYKSSLMLSLPSSAFFLSFFLPCFSNHPRSWKNDEKRKWSFSCCSFLSVLC